MGDRGGNGKIAEGTQSVEVGDETISERKVGCSTATNPTARGGMEGGRAIVRYDRPCLCTATVAFPASLLEEVCKAERRKRGKIAGEEEAETVKREEEKEDNPKYSDISLK